jgi:sec-independent protein translocase protein TatA
MRNPEILIILIVVGFLVFGAKRMPDAARGLGRSLRIFKAETKGLLSDDEQTAPPAQPLQIPTAAAPAYPPAAAPAPVQEAAPAPAPVQVAAPAPAPIAPVPVPAPAPAAEPVAEHRDAQ